MAFVDAADALIGFAYRLPTGDSKATKQKATARVAFASKSLIDLENLWWRFRDSNPGPADYDSVALTG